MFKNILLIGFLVFNLSGLGLGSYWVYISTLGNHKEAPDDSVFEEELKAFEKKLIESEPVFFGMDPVNTNLDGIPRYLIRLQLDFEMMNEQGFEEIVKLRAEARDVVIRILNAKTYEQVISIHGKLELKSQIISKVNTMLPNGVVKDVYFTDFAIQ
jgi:flagellar FliL protein